MAPHREWNQDCKVYIGNLGETSSKTDVESAFGRYGPLKNVWVARNPPGFAFVEFEDARDAEDAVRALDGTRINGTSRVRVEMSHGRSRPRGGFGGGRGGGGGGRREGGGRDGGRSFARHDRNSPRKRYQQRSRSRSASPPRRARDQSPSPVRARQRSYSRSPDYRSSRRNASRSPQPAIN